MNIIVTGYAGFIGFHLTKKLLKIQSINQIICIDNFNSYYDINLKYARHNEIINFDTKKNVYFLKLTYQIKKNYLIK